MPDAVLFPRPQRHPGFHLLGVGSSCSPRPMASVRNFPPPSISTPALSPFFLAPHSQGDLSDQAWTHPCPRPFEHPALCCTSKSKLLRRASNIPHQGAPTSPPLTPAQTTQQGEAVRYLYSPIPTQLPPLPCSPSSPPVGRVATWGP